MRARPATVAAGPFALAATLALYFAGAALGFVFLQSLFPVAAIPLVAAVSTAGYAARGGIRGPRAYRRVLGALGWTITVLAHALWIYLAIAWGSVLAWAVAWWGWSCVALLAVSVGVTAWRPIRSVRAPIALPLGAWIALCLWGWRVEEARARCDDLLALGADSRVSLVERTSRDLDACKPGEAVPIGRFPRNVWESRDGGRRLVATSAALGGAPPANARFTGSVCELSAGREPVCLGDGKAQAIVEAPARDRIFVAMWGHLGDGVRGRVLAIPSHGPFEVVGEARTTGSLGELFYEPRVDLLYAFTDEGGEIVRIVGSTMKIEPSVAATLPPPDAIRYDQARGEGVICASGGPVLSLEGKRFLSVAARGDPLSLRPVGTGPLALASMTWGCDFDPVSRRAWVAIPNLGLVATVDYDTGRTLRADFVGFGMRSVTHDAARKRLYLTSFLAGQVLAIDAETGAEVERWRVGRFPRKATLGRDGRSLLVGTNLGVVAIALAEAPGRL